MRFIIRDVLWLTVVVAVVLGWWRTSCRLDALAEENNANRIWQWRAEFLLSHWNGTKIDGKWIYPWRIEFKQDRDIRLPMRESGGESIVSVETARQQVEFKKEWAELR